jgi:AhpD family alkylhydroperoxidase
MESRLDFFRTEPAIFKVLLSVEEQIKKGSLDLKLKELVKMRASQINACAFCLDMHVTAAREAGETDRRLGTVSAWREAPFFTERERAALEWTEALTLVADTHVPDSVWETVRAVFSDTELMELTLVVTSINSWNRFAVGFRRLPG